MNLDDYTNLVDILDNGELGKSCRRVDFAVGVTVITNNKTGYGNLLRKLHVTSKEQNFLLTNLAKTKPNPCLGCVPGQLALKPELKFEFDKINNCYYRTTNYSTLFFIRFKHP